MNRIQFLRLSSLTVLGIATMPFIPVIKKMDVNSLNGVIYISELGNDFNDGSINSPVRSLNRAFNLARKGDTIYINEGIYK